MKNELIKAKYRLDDLQSDAQEIKDKVLALVPPTVIDEMLSGVQALNPVGDAIGHAVVEKNLAKIIDIALKLVTARRPVDVKAARPVLDSMMGKLAENFIADLSWAGDICAHDLRQWGDKAVIMGSNADANINTARAAWTNGTPALFADYRKRLTNSINGWHHAALQGCMFVLQGAK